MFYTINGKEGILATKGDSPESLAKRADLKVNYLMAYNDLEPSASISPNMVYYLERKNRRSKNAEYHTVKKGQSMWLISQMYAIRKNKLQRLNRMKKNEALQEGRIMHLSKRLKRKDAIQYKRLPFGNEQLPTEKAPILVENPTATLPAVASNVPTSTSTSEPAKPSIDENTVYVNTGERKVLVREKKPYDAPTEVVKSEANSMENPSKNPDGIHIVQAGETMFGIAKKYNILLSDLKAWNQKAGFEVTVGEYLKIVAPQLRMTPDTNTVYAKASSPKTTATIHTVQAGETLYRVSVNYGVPVEKIKADNSLTSNTIAVGQRLKISK